MNAIIGSTLFAALSLAQPQAPGPDLAQFENCVLHANWVGDGSEVAAIETAPVPESFRRNEHLGDCFPGLMVGALVSWHVQAGSGRSASAAIDYLEGRYRAPISDAGRIGPALDSALRAARADLGEGWPSNFRVPRNAALARLRSLSKSVENRAALAANELRAAEEFESMPMLVRAEAHLPALTEASLTLSRSPLTGSAAPPPVELRPSSVEELRARMAILRAHLTRNAADIERAKTLVSAMERPDYEEVADVTRRGGRDACDVTAYSDDTDDCVSQQPPRSDVASWLRNRGMIDLVAGEGDDMIRYAARILERGWAMNSRCCYSAREDDLLRIHMMTADWHRRQLDTATGAYDVQTHWSGAMAALSDALHQVSPTEAPARYQRIGQAWLNLWARGEALRTPDGDRPLTWQPYQQRFAIYLRGVLAVIPEIATVGDHNKGPVAAEATDQR